MDLARDGCEERGEVALREVAPEGARNLLVKGRVGLQLELVLERTQVEDLAEDVEEARQEEREDLERVGGRARRGEGDRAKQIHGKAGVS